MARMFQKTEEGLEMILLIIIKNSSLRILNLI